MENLSLVSMTISVVLLGQCQLLQELVGGSIPFTSYGNAIAYYYVRHPPEAKFFAATNELWGFQFDANLIHISVIFCKSSTQLGRTNSTLFTATTDSERT